jgi:protein-histidine pros-kinase
MGLSAKLNLLLLCVGLVSALTFALVLRPYLDELARGEVLQSSRIMMASAAGARRYTSEQIAPLLSGRMEHQFYPQAVSAYAAVKTFDVLHEQFSDYSYREPALNPTNPMDRATDWEADIIQEFRGHPTETESITTRQTLKGPVLNLSRPIRAGAPCLACHGEARAAPSSMIGVYGPDHGFGWKLNEIVAAQVVSAPMKVAFDRADAIERLFLGIYAGVFLALTVAINIGLRLLVTGPIVAMSRVAEEVSLGRMEAPEFEHRGSDEIARLAQAFTRMRRSLAEALRMLTSGVE